VLTGSNGPDMLCHVSRPPAPQPERGSREFLTRTCGHCTGCGPPEMQRVWSKQKKKGGRGGAGSGNGRTYGNVISEICLDKCKDGAAYEIFIGGKGLRERRSCREGMMNLPNKSMRPSAASRNELVSTPSGVMGMLANDCWG
jgi:hypothetical protein